jgi:hypothetical protein
MEARHWLFDPLRLVPFERRTLGVYAQISDGAAVACTVSVLYRTKKKQRARDDALWTRLWRPN